MKNIFVISLVGFILTACGGSVRPSVDSAFDNARTQAIECERMAKSGEIVGEYARVDCRTSALSDELSWANYPYPELLQKYTETVRELAMQVDCEEIDLPSAHYEMKQAHEEWLTAEQNACEVDQYAWRDTIKNRLNVKKAVGVEPIGFRCFDVR